MKHISLLAVLVSAFSASAALTVESVSVRQCWPWSGDVIVDYTLSGGAPGEVRDVEISFANGSETLPLGVATLDGGTIARGNGSYRAVWHPETAGATGYYADFKATVTVPDADTWMVVDLSGGATASSYPITFTSVPPDGGWNQDVYKSDKLVLRRIPAGAAILGAPEDEIGRTPYSNTQRKTTFTNAFYMAIFETTQAQFRNVLGYNPATASTDQPGFYADEKNAVGYTPYALVRGTNALERTVWPQHEEASFLGALNAKVAAGLAAAGRSDYELELPTVSQWEYACRAGTTGAWNNGTTIVDENTDPNASLLGYYGLPYIYYPRNPGLLQPNAYGLYDMHGNSGEIVRDYLRFTNLDTRWWDGSDQVEPLIYGPDIYPYYNYPFRVGGSYQGNAGAIRSSSTDLANSANGHRTYGFRLALTRKR